MDRLGISQPYMGLAEVARRWAVPIWKVQEAIRVFDLATVRLGPRRKMILLAEVERADEIQTKLQAALTLPAAAKRLGMTLRRLERFIKQRDGKIRIFKVGRQRYMELSEIEHVREILAGFLKVTDLANLLRRSWPATQVFINRQKIKTEKIGRFRYIPKSEIERVLRLREGLTSAQVAERLGIKVYGRCLRRICGACGVGTAYRFGASRRISLHDAERLDCIFFLAELVLHQHDHTEDCPCFDLYYETPGVWGAALSVVLRLNPEELTEWKRRRANESGYRWNKQHPDARRAAIERHRKKRDALRKRGRQLENLSSEPQWVRELIIWMIANPQSPKREAYGHLEDLDLSPPRKNLAWLEYGDDTKAGRNRFGEIRRKAGLGPWPRE